MDEEAKEKFLAKLDEAKAKQAVATPAPTANPVETIDPVQIEPKSEAPQWSDLTKTKSATRKAPIPAVFIRTPPPAISREDMIAGGRKVLALDNLIWQYNNGHLKARSVHKSLRFSNKLVSLQVLILLVVIN